MEINHNEVEINGVKYVRKDSVSSVELNTENYVIVRSYAAGVFAGNMVKKEGQEVTLKNARRLWYWDGAASLSQLAVDGVSKPQNCKFPKAVPEIIITKAEEIITCSLTAFKSIAEVKEWKA
jgi:hypothetical protein